MTHPDEQPKEVTEQALIEVGGYAAMIFKGLIRDRVDRVDAAMITGAFLASLIRKPKLDE